MAYVRLTARPALPEYLFLPHVLAGQVRKYGMVKKRLFISLCLLLCQAGVASEEGRLVPGNVQGGFSVYAPMSAQQAKTEKVDRTGTVYDLFALALAEFNEKLAGRIGFAPFVGSKNLGKGRMEITATGTWLALTRRQREAQLAEVFAIWAAVLGEGRTITLSVVDQDGAQSMFMLR